MKDGQIVAEIIEAFLELCASNLGIIEHGSEESHLRLAQVVLVHPSQSLHLWKVVKERLTHGNKLESRTHRETCGYTLSGRSGGKGRRLTPNFARSAADRISGRTSTVGGGGGAAASFTELSISTAND